ncbi:MAG: AAA family ATPase [Vicinamibacterales bacterium]
MKTKSFSPVQLGDCHPVTVLMPDPDPLPPSRFVGRRGLLACCQAAWFGVDGDALHFRLSGPPGVGKNELVYELARLRQQPLYIIQGHEELMPEDLACTARIADGQRIEYVGSPLLAAMLVGGVCFFDEIGKVPSRALSLLASVLDDRRTISSVLGGFTVQAHPGFRFCAAMNDADAATAGLPGFLDERLRPAFTMGYAPAAEVAAIAAARVRTNDAALLNAFSAWAASEQNLSPRRAIALLNYIVRQQSLGARAAHSTSEVERLIAEARQLFADVAA